MKKSLLVPLKRDLNAFHFLIRGGKYRGKRILYLPDGSKYNYIIYESVDYVIIKSGKSKMTFDDLLRCFYPGKYKK